jgi:hypothetical protein
MAGHVPSVISFRAIPPVERNNLHESSAALCVGGPMTDGQVSEPY